MKKKNYDWIADYIRIKEASLTFAYCRGDIESAYKIEEDIKNLEILFSKKLDVASRKAG